MHENPTLGFIAYYRIGDGCFQLAQDYLVQTSLRPKEVLELPYIKLWPDGMLKLSRGFVWDGATGGRDTDDALRGSAGHDGLCNLMAAGLLAPWWECRLLADQDLYRWCREDGMRWVRTRLFWRGVRVYARLRRSAGRGAAAPLPVLIAPRHRAHASEPRVLKGLT